MQSWIGSTSRVVGVAVALSCGGSLAACTALLGDFSISVNEAAIDGSLADTGASEAGPREEATAPPGEDAAEDAGTDVAQLDASACAANQKLCNGACVNTGLPASGCASPTSCAPCVVPGAVAACDSKGA
jgi:hypothetical protein